MTNIDTLITKLKSEDSSVRNAAAIELMDIGDPRAIEPLVEAIRVPENVNHRGTLVYALSAFNCIEHLDLLVGLVLTGNYEVAAGAFQLIEESTLNDSHIAKIKQLLEKVDTSSLKTEHNQDGYESLMELVR